MPGFILRYPAHNSKFPQPNVREICVMECTCNDAPDDDVHETILVSQ